MRLALLHDLFVNPVHAFWDGRDEIDIRYLAAGAVLLGLLLGDGNLRVGLSRLWSSLDLKRICRTRAAWLDALIFVLNFGAFGAIATFVRQRTPSAEAAGRNAAAAVTFWTDQPVLSAFLAGMLLTVFSFVAADLLFYAVHRAMHRIPFLWAWHKVHHSSPVLYPLTAFRGHPVQLVIVSALGSVVASFVLGAMRAIGGGGVSSVTFLSTNALLALFFVFGATFRHSAVWVVFPGPLRHVIHSPAHHQIHHSADPTHFNSNYSGYLVFFDRIFGTLIDPIGQSKPDRFGVGDGRVERMHANPIGVFLYPFVDAARALGLSRGAASRTRIAQHH